MTKAPIDETVFNQALSWVVRLRAEDLSEAEVERFAEWLTSSESCKQAWEEALDLWETTGVISSLPIDDLLKVRERENISFFPNRFVHKWRPWAVAASLFVAIVSVLTFLNTDTTEIYETGFGEYLEVTLEDGSVIELNTNTSLEVEYEKNARDIELIKGEAYFSVASNKESPFTVNFGNASAQALGTAFNVYRQTSKKAVVTVTEGVVRVAENIGSTTSAAQSELLLANHSVVVDDAKGLSALSVVDGSQLTIWRDQQIVFDNTPLSKAVITLNRYLEHQVVLSDRVPSGLRVSGVFSSKQQDKMVLAVAQALDLEADKQGENWLLSQPHP